MSAAVYASSKVKKRWPDIPISTALRHGELDKWKAENEEQRTATVHRRLPRLSLLTKLVFALHLSKQYVGLGPGSSDVGAGLGRVNLCCCTVTAANLRVDKCNFMIFVGLLPESPSSVSELLSASGFKTTLGLSGSLYFMRVKSS